MIEIKGKYNTAICFTSELAETSSNQIQIMCDEKAFKDNKIRIMPDVHAGKGCTIGTTMTITDKVVPGMVGVDIGCGMETVKIAETEIDFKRLDALIHSTIPSGQKVRKEPHSYNSHIDLNELNCASHVNLERAKNSIGTLGGGNHFIEVDRSKSGELYIVIHSGSRHLGYEVANYYQNQGQKIDISKDLSYIEGQLFDNYIEDMHIVQHFATLNRKAMMDEILAEMNYTKVDEFTTIHNYIDTDSMILRKGSVSAKDGEKLLIPINMRDGSLICIGKGNPNWNFSAPHGAGRLMSRTQAFANLSLEKFREEMQGIYSTCVKQKTLDESPMAYKSMSEIVEQIEPTAEIVEQIKPIYNFKAAER
ncbi:MAG: RtcB family protein [Clostridiales bacterium]|nr:RtcB family protein [Clostridiales bacterium]